MSNGSKVVIQLTELWKEEVGLRGWSNRTVAGGLGNRLMNPYRCAGESRETDLKLCFIDSIISRLDSQAFVNFRAQFAVLRRVFVFLLAIIG
jgi:hypothetical protein